MTVRRLWAVHLPEGGGEIFLDENASKHARVLRLGKGDSVALFDGAGHEAAAIIDRVSDGRWACRTSEPTWVGPRGPRVVLIQSLPKGDRLDAIVRMATEIGVSVVQLATSERTEGRIDSSTIHKRLTRLERIAREAARQSGRSDIPDIVPPVQLVAAAERAPSDAARIVFWEESRTPLPDRFEQRTAWVVIGPEGGLSQTEIGRLKAIGYQPFSMATFVLRVDTAAAVGVALLRDRMKHGETNREDAGEDR